MLCDYYSGLGGRELLQLAKENHAGCEIAYGDSLVLYKFAKT